MLHRRLLLSLAALTPFRSARAARKGVYAQLGIRPLINFQGTMTTLGASKMAEEVHAAMAEASRDFVYLQEVQDRGGGAHRQAVRHRERHGHVGRRRRNCARHLRESHR